MKNVTFSLVLLSTFSFAGGELSSQSIDELIAQEDLNQANQQVFITPPVVIKKEVFKKEIIKKEIVPKEVVPKIIKRAIPEKVSVPKFYIGAAVANSEIDTENANEIIKNAHPLVAIVKVGYNVMDNFAIEGRAGFGIKEDKISFTKNKVNSIVAAYVKPNMNVSKNINLFGLLGYAKTKMEQEVLSSEVSAISYGAGLSYGLNDNLSMVGDFVRYGKKGIDIVDTVSLGLDYTF